MRCVTIRNIIRRLLWGSLVCVSSCSSLHQFPAAPSFNSSLAQNPTWWTPTILERSEVGQGGGSNRHTPRTRPGVGRATPQREIQKQQQVGKPVSACWRACPRSGLDRLQVACGNRTYSAKSEFRPQDPNFDLAWEMRLSNATCDDANLD